MFLSNSHEFVIRLSPSWQLPKPWSVVSPPTPPKHSTARAGLVRSAWSWRQRDASPGSYPPQRWSLLPQRSLLLVPGSYCRLRRLWVRDAPQRASSEVPAHKAHNVSPLDCHSIGPFVNRIRLLLRLHLKSAEEKWEIIRYSPKTTSQHQYRRLATAEAQMRITIFGILWGKQGHSFSLALC